MQKNEAGLHNILYGPVLVVSNMYSGFIPAPSLLPPPSFRVSVDALMLINADRKARLDPAAVCIVLFSWCYGK